MFNIVYTNIKSIHPKKIRNMKFCKNLLQVIELSDPEWGYETVKYSSLEIYLFNFLIYNGRPFWINYKYLKKKIKSISNTTSNNNGKDISNIISTMTMTTPKELSKLPCEVDFFKELKCELKECSDFFTSLEIQYMNRLERISFGYHKLKVDGNKYDKKAWSRLLWSCVKLYRDSLLLEHFAITNYFGYSKILKKHDKKTGLVTRDAFLRNMIEIQKLILYPNLMNILVKSEELFSAIHNMDS